MKHSLVRFAIICCAFGHLACDSTGVGNPPRAPELGTEEDALIADGDEGTRAAEGASSLIAIPLHTLTKPDQLTSSEGAAAVSEFGRVQFAPASCVTTARVTDVITWTFTDCGGRFGVGGLSGKLIVTYLATTTGLTLDYRSEGLTMEKLDGATVQKAGIVFQATAHVSFVGTSRKVQWNGNVTVTLPGKTVTHVPSYDTMFENGCVDMEGGATTTVQDARGARTFESNWVGYRRCGDKRACPEAGGTLTIQGKPTNFIVRVKLLGGQAVEVTSSTRPKPVVIENKLQCIP